MNDVVVELFKFELVREVRFLGAFDGEPELKGFF